jgi:hypothetical protein
MEGGSAVEGRGDVAPRVDDPDDHEFVSFHAVEV